MKFSPKEVKDNVNVSSESAVKGFFDLTVRILGVILVVYLALGVAVDYIAPRLSAEAETKIGKLFFTALERKGPFKTEEKIQAVVDKLVTRADTLPRFNYRVYIRDSKDVNAVALPGGTIVVFSGLLEGVESQNELAMILAHELGHFSNRDHLRGIGRGLVLLTLSVLTLGTDNGVSRLIADSINNMERSFSQSQEKAADLYALHLLNKTYGHTAGALDFYQKMSKKNKSAWIFYVFSSHPYMKDRVRLLQEAILKNGYRAGEKIPIDIYGYTKPS
jgi:Zn-dependent protease with chaperone function